ncbi:cation diffusion facilitator family transporter [Patescibacteria group bacterium]|nr:cation diffusion facilitator family transporter [Patescibacteria group bacterium]MBU4512755.1 cation diffusion facilitator family transporter [Patescibacteria group bacterium]MCG2693095.1 cation diffusion facilitator family transporter [Candidatus Parcubacteria bacterium]
MKEKIALTSILANMVLAGGKITVGVFSNSAAILAAGIDSLSDIFSSAISYVGIKISKKPADQEHPYGHHKFEVLGGVIITTIVLATGIGIIYKAYQNFLNPEDVKISYLAFGVMLFSAAANEVMARLKIYYGKKESSVSLLSDGFHSRVDVYTSLAILAGLFLTQYWIYTDAFLALLMGLCVIKGAFSIGKEAAGSLLDVSAGQEIEEKIKSIAQEQNIEIDALKTQKKGSAVTANLEIKLPKDLSVDEATKISGRLREKMINEIEGLQYVAVQITSHEMETGFYKPDFGRGLGWQRKGRFKEKMEKAAGQGPGGCCVCLKCGYKTSHQRGVPCSTLKCPACNINLERK